MAKVKAVQFKTTVPGLGCYVTVFEPRAAKEGQKAKYSVSLLWKKDDPKAMAMLKELKALCVKQAHALFDGKFKKPETVDLMIKEKNIKLPIRNGDVDKPDNETYAGCYFLNASSIRQPALVDAKAKKVFEESECYSGCTFRAILNLAPYDQDGGQGVACYLEALQVVHKGERIGGNGIDAEAAFAEFAEVGEEKPAESGDDLVG